MQERTRGSGPTPRRRFLGAVGSAVTLGAVGCTGVLDDDADTWEEGGPPDRSGWEVTFEDRFESGELDRDVWENGFGDEPLQCPYHGGRAFCTVPEQSFVADDRLVLEAAEETPTVPEEERWQEGSDPRYSVGVVNTEDAFQQTYGYVEAKTRVDAEPGTNPAFWLFAIGDDVHREINVEFRGDHHGDVVDVGLVAELDGPDVRVTSEQYELETPTDEAFHVWGIEWTPDSVAVDVDGERVFTNDGFVRFLREEPMWIVLDFAVFDAAEWIGDPAEAEFPLRFETEWVRAWQHEDWA